MATPQKENEIEEKDGRRTLLSLFNPQDFKASSTEEILNAFFVTPDGDQLDSSTCEEVELMKAKLGFMTLEESIHDPHPTDETMEEESEFPHDDSNDTVHIEALSERLFEKEETTKRNEYQEGEEPEDLVEVIWAIFCNSGDGVSRPAFVCSKCNF
jgi:hypothetical protein